MTVDPPRPVKSARVEPMQVAKPAVNSHITIKSTSPVATTTTGYRPANTASPDIDLRRRSNTFIKLANDARRTEESHTESKAPVTTLNIASNMAQCPALTEKDTLTIARAVTLFTEYMANFDGNGYCDRNHHQHGY